MGRPDRASHGPCVPRIGACAAIRLFRRSRHVRVPAIVFAVLAVLPWQLVLSLWTAASIAALVLTVWLTLGGEGYRPGMARLGGTLLLSAVLFWTAPVMHAIN